MSNSITGTVVYQQIGMGFWGIEDTRGNQYRPVQMPKALQKKGAKVRISFSEADNQMSIFMWGTAIVIHDYELL